MSTNSIGNDRLIGAAMHKEVQAFTLPAGVSSDAAVAARTGLATPAEARMTEMLSRVDSMSGDVLSHIFLVRIFEAINLAHIDCALLRGHDAVTPASGVREIDVLVAPQHMSRLGEILLANEFVKLPAWGHAPHHFFIAHDVDEGAWWKLDVVTDLRYGASVRVLRAGSVNRWLDCRSTDRRLAPEHEFVGLILHCVLDRASFNARHRMRLTALRTELNWHQHKQQTAAQEIERWLAPALSWKIVSYAIETQRWRQLLGRRAALMRQMFWRRPLKTTWDYLCARSTRLLRPLLFAIWPQGATVALVGPDGAGKTTLAHALMREKPLRARQIYMGNNFDPAGMILPVTRWSTRRGKVPHNDISQRSRPLLSGLSFMRRMVEQWRRYALARFHRRRGRLVIFDRYVHDLGLREKSSSPTKKLRRWLLRAGAPTPDLVVVLDAPGALLYQRKGEHTPARLEQMRRAYLRLLERYPQAVVVDATSDAGTVKKKVAALIWSRYVARAAARQTI